MDMLTKDERDIINELASNMVNSLNREEYGSNKDLLEAYVLDCPDAEAWSKECTLSLLQDLPDLGREELGCWSEDFDRSRGETVEVFDMASLTAQVKDSRVLIYKQPDFKARLAYVKRQAKKDFANQRAIPEGLKLRRANARAAIKAIDLNDVKFIEVDVTTLAVVEAGHPKEKVRRLSKDESFTEMAFCNILQGVYYMKTSGRVKPEWIAYFQTAYGKKLSYKDNPKGWMSLLKSML